MFPVRDVNEIILNESDDKTLNSLCMLNLEARKICNDDQFWRRRILKLYGEDILQAKKASETYRDFYTGPIFREYVNKIYPWCLDLLKIPKLSQMVIDDFYNPTKGFINSAFTRRPAEITYLLLKIVFGRDNSAEIRKLIKSAENDIPEIHREQFDFDTYYLTEKEKNEFLRIIDVKQIRPTILKNVGKIRPSAITSIENAPEVFKLVMFIHNGFETGQLPLDIKWDELCTHPYLLTEFSYV